ncbi:unnamed protein product [Heterobilharzia americana]|nr:unnamed protein product [Heterobilharzia americana]
MQTYTDQKIITIQQEVVQIKDVYKPLLTMNDLKNNSYISEPTILQIIKSTKSDHYQVVCLKPIPFGAILGPFCINEGIQQSGVNHVKNAYKSSKLLSISDTYTTVVDSSLINSTENTTILWMTLVRDVSVMNLETQQIVSENTKNSLKSNIVIISLLDSHNNHISLQNNNNNNSKDLHLANISSEQNSRRILYFKTQRCINFGEELLLSERNPLYNMHLLNNVSVKSVHSTGNSPYMNSSTKKCIERNLPVNSNLNNRDVFQNYTHIDKRQISNTNIRNYMNNGILQSYRSSLQNDIRLQQINQQQRMKNYTELNHLYEPMKNPLDKSWNNISKLSGKGYKKHKNALYFDESMKSAFSCVQSKVDSDQSILPTTQSITAINHVIDYSNDIQSFKQTENIVKGQVKSDRMTETSPGNSKSTVYQLSMFTSF